jgi:hypothetical protein
MEGVIGMSGKERARLKVIEAARARRDGVWRHRIRVAERARSRRERVQPNVVSASMTASRHPADNDQDPRASGPVTTKLHHDQLP